MIILKTTFKTIKIDDFKIYKNKFHRPYLIAEIGVNYYDIAKKEKIDLIEAAKLMIKGAKKAGCNAIKFQSYTAEKLASKYATAFWDTKIIKEKNQIQLYKKYDKLSKDEYIDLQYYAKKFNINFLTTVFDEDLVDELDDFLNTYKIASADLTNYILVKKIAKTEKTILLSTGAAKFKEIKRTIRWIEEEKNHNIIPLHCVLSYPTKNKDAYFGYIKNLDKQLAYPIGYSCHIIPEIGMPHLITAWLLGAKVIEKHFTLDKSLVGNDHYHAFDAEDGVLFNKEVKKILTLYGNDNKREIIDSEKIARKNARRSLFAKKRIKKGDLIKIDQITAKRPAGVGIDAEFASKIIGKIAKRDIDKDDPLNFRYFI